MLASGAPGRARSAEIDASLPNQRSLLALGRDEGARPGPPGLRIVLDGEVGARRELLCELFFLDHPGSRSSYPITPPVSSEMLLPVTTETTLRPQSTTSATSSSGL